MGKGETGITVVSWDICSLAGARRQNGRNDDYGLFDASIGGCLADGVGSYPLADALARYACHTAFGSMKKGFGAREALGHAQMRVADFAKTAGSPKSGTALTVLKKTGNGFEVAWIGDVVCLLAREGRAPLERLVIPHRCGRQLTRQVGAVPYEPSVTTFAAQNNDRIVMCTDGVWDELSDMDILKAMTEAETPRETCARLVLGRQPNDDATAIALVVG